MLFGYNPRDRLPGYEKAAYARLQHEGVLLRIKLGLPEKVRRIDLQLRAESSLLMKKEATMKEDC
jgi:hypothetical protein